MDVPGSYTILRVRQTESFEVHRVTQRPVSLVPELFLVKVALAGTADGAGPIIGQTLERSAWRYTTVGITKFWFVDIATNLTDIFIHGHRSPFGR